MPIMLLRNICPQEGLCNGTRLIITRLLSRIIEAEIAIGQHAGRRVFISRMPLIPSETNFPFELKRIQFPIRPAFAMTINKSQGQSLKFVGLWLNEPVFTHGQLYVALSRVSCKDDIIINLKPGTIQTLNVVYKEALENT